MSALASLPKQYARRKLALTIIHGATQFTALLVAIATPLSRTLEFAARSVFANDYAAFLLFAVMLAGAIEILTLPLSYYSGFTLEHRYGLSTQTNGGWIVENLKMLALTAIIGLPLLALFYWIVCTYQGLWWLPAGIAMFLVSVVLARLAPVFILPLFYKFIPLENAAIKRRITTICERGGMNVEGVYRFNMSKNTKKANAAFTGIGRSKRIILGDTLLEKFDPEEIDAVVAHEIGHYVRKHLWRRMTFASTSTFLGLYLMSVLYAHSIAWFGYTNIPQIAALPLLGLWLGIYSLAESPIGNALSRKYEYEADAYALRVTQNKAIFARMMQKLAETNLADTAPHPLVEFWFHDHPSIEKRIRAAQSL